VDTIDITDLLGKNAWMAATMGQRRAGSTPKEAQRILRATTAGENRASPGIN
jgi:hypothetical protein